MAVICRWTTGTTWWAPKRLSLSMSTRRIAVRCSIGFIPEKVGGGEDAAAAAISGVVDSAAAGAQGAEQGAP